ncbi:MAG: retropepsin-like aspartic protease [Novosphingobium sp.]
MNGLPLLGLAAALASAVAAHAGAADEASNPQARYIAELSARAAPLDPLPTAARAGSHRIRRAPDGMFYVHAMVNGARVRFLVDTGASHTILTKADAARVGARAKRMRGVVTAAGVVRFGWATLDRMSLAGREMAGTIAAISGERLPVSLLGQDMLANFASVTIAGDSLWLS